MRRFTTNRWWAFILALSVLVGSSATFSSPSFGDGGLDPTLVDGGGDSGGGGTGTKGDPDGPSGPTQRLPGGRRGVSDVGGFTAASVGDGGAAAGAWSWRIHVMLRTLTKGWFQL